MDIINTMYKIDSQHPSLDVAAEMTTTLEVASLVFHKYDASYSKQIIS